MRRPAVFALCRLRGIAGAAAAAVAAFGAVACGGPSFAGTPTDASVTSPPVVTVDGGSFCLLEAGAHTFCDDFDGLPLSSKWDSIDQGTGGTARTDSTISDSPPASFKSVAPASLAAETRGRVEKTFGMASHIVVAFDIAIDATPIKLATGALGGDSLLGIYVGPSYSIGLRAHTDEVGYFEDLTTDAGTSEVLTTKDLVATPTLAGWTSVVITIDLANANLSISIGGVALIDQTPITPPNGQSIAFYLGAFSRNQAQSLAAHYDNVTVDITP
jgi:hypothetical protein